MSGSIGPDVVGVFDPTTHTVSYVVSDPASGAALIIDPVLDFDPAAARVSTTSVDRLLRLIDESGLRLEYILETHAHADHMTGADEIRRRTGASIGVGSEITRVQKTFATLFEAADVRPDASAFDRTFVDGDRFALGRLEVEILHAPGHTPACVSYRIGDAVFVGDTLFMPDFGTARCDFPGGDARTLYRSIQRILALPEETRMFVGHDYLPETRTEVAWERPIRRCVRSLKKSARCVSRSAKPDPAGLADQHSRRRDAAGGTLGKAVSEDAVERMTFGS